MTRTSLSDTLIALAEAVMPGHPVIAIEAAEIDLPLIVALEHGPDGPRLTAQPPHSVFRAGFEPVTHRARLSFADLPLPGPKD